MKILVINSGSSSLKYQFINMDTEKVIAKGICEKIGLIDSFIIHKTENNMEKKINIFMKDHKDAFAQVKDALINDEYGVIKNLDEVTAIGHRVVQGGTSFIDSTIIDEQVLSSIEKMIPLAPLHNPANLQGINACMQVFGEKMSQVAVFDTSFHSTMPEKAYMFAIPYKYYKKYGIRRYGFHGISHKYVSEKCISLLDKKNQDTKIITCHLGNGSSIAAIDGGKVIDTSMGFTPLDGFIMGTRSGTLDPSIITFLAQHEKMTLQELDTMLNKESGLLGISGVSSDCREIDNAKKAGNCRAALASEMLIYQIVKFIGSYIAALNGCDAIVFTGGIGENQCEYRKRICESLSFFGIEIDNQKNNITVGGNFAEISTENSKVKVFVIPTNEELIIARDTKNLVEKLS